MGNMNIHCKEMERIVKVAIYLGNLHLRMVYICLFQLTDLSLSGNSLIYPLLTLAD